jgi:hypothetical protein
MRLRHFEIQYGLVNIRHSPANGKQPHIYPDSLRAQSIF